MTEQTVIIVYCLGIIVTVFVASIVSYKINDDMFVLALTIISLFWPLLLWVAIVMVPAFFIHLVTGIHFAKNMKKGVYNIKIE